MHHVGNDAAVRNVKKITIESLQCHTHVALEIKYINNIKKISKRSLSIFRLRFFIIIFLFFFTRIFFAKLQLRKNQTG